MLTYKLYKKVEDESMDSVLEFVYKNADQKCLLIIDANYYIKRYEWQDILYYVHIKNGAVSKICIYQKENRYE